MKPKKSVTRYTSDLSLSRNCYKFLTEAPTETPRGSFLFTVVYKSDENAVTLKNS